MALGRVLEGLLDVVYPPMCLSCGSVLEGAGFFCPACSEELERVPPPSCSRCCEPVDAMGVDCPRCQAVPPPFSKAFAPFVHDGAISRAIHLFKYEDRPDLARPLARLLAESASPFLDAAPTELAAIPLHADRFRERRYDQAELLTRELARLTGRSVRSHALERVRRTERQVGLSETRREQNVAGAFVAPATRGRVLLVDDVFTTGATARAAGHALLLAGVDEVQVLTIARAVRGNI